MRKHAPGIVVILALAAIAAVVYVSGPTPVTDEGLDAKLAGPTASQPATQPAVEEEIEDDRPQTLGVLCGAACGFLGGYVFRGLFGKEKKS